MSGPASTTPARSLILGRIRDTLGERPTPCDIAYQRIPRGYHAAATLTSDACLDLLEDRLRHYQVAVHRCDASKISELVGEILTARGAQRMIVPPDIERGWVPAGVEFTPDHGLSYPELDRCGGVLTACSLAIASTGTIVLRHAAGEGRRALTLIPDYHLCVVQAAQVVQTVPEGIRRLAALQPALVTTISGPSATADIEMTRVRGVHGPRTLSVILASDNRGSAL
jgi:L-lactate dehydrogenase complex protein LldG